jgi:hypothetical protein
VVTAAAPTAAPPRGVPTATPRDPVRPGATRTPTPRPGNTSVCVARVEATVKFPTLKGGTQTVNARVLDATGNPIVGASAEALVRYSTTTRSLPLRPTDANGRTSTAWNVGGPKGTVYVDVTASGGGCRVQTTTTFQGRAA